MITPNFEDQIEKAKEKEAYISFELYRLLRNAVSKGLIYEDSNCMFKEVIPEFPIGKERADLVVFVTKSSSRVQPFLVIEVKIRAYARPGPSVAKATKRVLQYATELGATVTPFFAVNDGWQLLIFKNIHPYLVGAYGSINDEYHAKNLLLGLEEFSYKNKRNLLNTLPKHADPDFLLKRIMPSVANQFTKDPEEAKALLKTWRRAM
jgi:hypothetical protein